MAALAFALAEQLSPRSASSWRIVFFLPLTMVVTSALAVASDLQSPCRPPAAVEELLDDELAFADVDTDVSSAEAMRISNVPMLIAINPPIAPAAAITAGSGQRMKGSLRIARLLQKNARQRAADDAGRPHRRTRFKRKQRP